MPSHNFLYTALNGTCSTNSKLIALFMQWSMVLLIAKPLVGMCMMLDPWQD